MKDTRKLNASWIKNGKEVERIENVEKVKGYDHKANGWNLHPVRLRERGSERKGDEQRGGHSIDDKVTR